MIDNQESPSKEFDTKDDVWINYPANVADFLNPENKILREQLATTQQALDSANADIAASEISHKEWVLKRAEMFRQLSEARVALNKFKNGKFAIEDRLE